MLDFLFNIVVYPIQILINIAFINIANAFKTNCGIAIIGVSFLISLLCLPMYDKAHKLSEEESELQKRMEPKLKSIKRNFKGDERHMLISTYYRENNYSPFMALRNSLSLFIQIPFFIAAYLFFSHLPILQNQDFLFLKNIAMPDNLIHIGKYTINFMPILMTIVNIVAGEIYTKGHCLRERIQIYGVGLIFLVLLYNSPSGLVLYWTCNNIFSLFKNISYRMKNPIYMLYASFGIIYIATLAFWIIKKKMFYYNYCSFGLVLLFMAAIPFIIEKYGSKISDILEKIIPDNKETDYLLLTIGITNAIIFGAFVPFNVVASSPFEFSFIGSYSSPLEILIYPIYQAFGIFVFWPWCIAKMFSPRVKNVLIFILGGVLFSGLLNLFVFHIDLGSVTSTLVLDSITPLISYKPVLESLQIVCNILIIIFFATLVIYRKFKIIQNAAMIIMLSGLVASIFYGFKIQKDFLEYKVIRKENNVNYKKLPPFINMTQKGKNVIIFMFDRAISSFLPIIFEKRPDLKEHFDGFVYYPNTVSYSSHTITAAAPLYGGYEYTPEMQNLKSDRLMSDKHDEAIFTLPTLFMKNNWNATMSDAPLVQHKWIADPRVFKERGIKYENLIGKYATKYKYEHAYDEVIDEGQILTHNFLFYSFMNAVPQIYKVIVYQGGKYWNAMIYDQNFKTNAKVGVDNYSALYYLPEITVADSDQNAFFFLQNELTHTDFALEYPDFVPKAQVKNLGPNFFNDMKSYTRYQTNVAMVILAAKWLDRLKELGVYDNTRIIFASDHGIEVKIPGFDKFMNNHITPYNPILLMKDFNSKGSIKTDRTFMTNADVPYYATLGLFEQINPVTNKKLTTEPKKNGVNILLDLKRVPEQFRNANCIDEKSKMWHVKDDIMNKNNWSNVKPSELQLQKAREGKRLKGRNASNNFGSRYGKKIKKYDFDHTQMYGKSK